jgi:hypothetical protein
MTLTNLTSARRETRLRRALVLDLREFALDFGSSALRMTFAWRAMLLLGLDGELSLDTAILLGGTRIVDKGTNWMARTRGVVASWFALERERD